MFRSPSFERMGQQHHHTAQPAPLVFSARDELIDDDLCGVGEISILRFPDHEAIRTIQAVSVFEAENAGLRQWTVADLDGSLVRRDVLKGDVTLVGFNVVQNSVPLAERSSFGILAG